MKDLSPDELKLVLDTALSMKKNPAEYRHKFAGKTLAMIFQKPSLRTRVSFEAGMTQMGGHAIYLAPTDISIGQRETTEDIALVLSRFVDIIMARTFGHDIVIDLAKYATVPVINGLSDHEHPCQILADLFTLREKGVDLDRAVVAYIGDGNNVANSWIESARLFGLEVRIACPEGYDPDPKLVAQVQKSGPGRVRVLRSPAEAAQEADVLYTDVWASMGQEAEREKRLPVFRTYQINRSILRMAKPGAWVMHCLPAHRGEEITEDVFEGPQSIVFPQAENRMHLQKAILHDLLVGRGVGTKKGAARRRTGARPARKSGARPRRAPPRSRRGR